MLKERRILLAALAASYILSFFARESLRGSFLTVNLGLCRPVWYAGSSGGSWGNDNAGFGRGSGVVLSRLGDPAS
ncbi:MAG: hypothetical protein ACOX5M_00065 [Bacillota bacterium]